jgi:hypothetical protein
MHTSTSRDSDYGDDNSSMDMSTAQIFEMDDIDTTIEEAKSDLVEGRAFLQNFSGREGRTNFEIREHAKQVLDATEASANRSGDVVPMVEEANPYKKRAASTSVAALADEAFEDHPGDFNETRNHLQMQFE